MSTHASSRPTPRAAWHHGPAWLWLLSFVLCIGSDALLGRWVLMPIYVAGFYGGMIVIDLLTYPMLERWRAWLQPRGVWAWYLVEVGVMWIGSAIVLAALGLLGPRWLDWTWQGPRALQAAGARSFQMASNARPVRPGNRRMASCRQAALRAQALGSAARAASQRRHCATALAFARAPWLGRSVRNQNFGRGQRCWSHKAAKSSRWTSWPRRPGNTSGA